MSVLRRIRAIASKEVRQLRRDRLTLGMVIGIPLMQIVLFGYAINLDVRHLRAAVADQGDPVLAPAGAWTCRPARWSSWSR
jgi:ABC-2 type transport system permease protein